MGRLAPGFFEDSALVFDPRLASMFPEFDSICHRVFRDMLHDCGDRPVGVPDFTDHVAEGSFQLQLTLQGGMARRFSDFNTVAK
jgi:hypothetical protein